MALGEFDALCGICNTRLGTHGRYYCGTGDIKFYCPIKTNWSNDWGISSDLIFVDSGKKRSAYCDQRNNPGLYLF